MPDSRTLVDLFESKYATPALGRALVVGSRVFSEREDRRQRYADAVGVDQQAGEGVDQVLDLEAPLPEGLGQFAHIDCLSVLEHSRRPWLLAANLERLLLPGGTLFLTAPFVWRVHAYPSDFWRFSKEGIRALFPGIAWHHMVYAHESLKHNDMVPAIHRVDGGIPFFARTEVLAFGERPAA